MQIISYSGENAVAFFSQEELMFINNAFVYAMDKRFANEVQWSEQHIENLFKSIRQAFVEKGAL